MIHRRGAQERLESQMIWNVLLKCNPSCVKECWTRETVVAWHERMKLRRQQDAVSVLKRWHSFSTTAGYERELVLQEAGKSAFIAKLFGDEKSRVDVVTLEYCEEGWLLYESIKLTLSTEQKIGKYVSKKKMKTGNHCEISKEWSLKTVSREESKDFWTRPHGAVCRANANACGTEILLQRDLPGMCSKRTLAGFECFPVPSRPSLAKCLEQRFEKNMLA